MSPNHRHFLEVVGAGALSGNLAASGDFVPTRASSTKSARTWEGIWAGLPTPFSPDFSLDLSSLEANIRRMLKAGVHGVYLLGSTGEFYTIEFDEFQQLADLLVKTAAGSGTPVAINCGTPNTRATLRQLEYARQAGCDAAQLTIPYWMEMTPREVLRFFKDVATAVPALPIIHYNIPRAKHYLLGPDYVKVREVCPNLVAIKFTFSGSHWADLQEAIRLNPTVKFYISEHLLVSAVQLGARGSCSAKVYTNSGFVLKMYRLAQEKKWDQAMPMQRRLAELSARFGPFAESLGEGRIDPQVDKALGIASGTLVGHQRTRLPFIGWSDKNVQALREWMKKDFPEFMAA